jgi:hypothetical protein
LCGFLSKVSNLAQLRNGSNLVPEGILKKAQILKKKLIKNAINLLMIQID